MPFNTTDGVKQSNVTEFCLSGQLAVVLISHSPR